jgi:IPT/TIG domain
MTSPHQDRVQDESGAVIILALVFLVAVSLIVIGLLTFVGTSLKVTSGFANERAVESAATSAVNLAIQNTRYPTATAQQLSSGGAPQLQLLNVSPPQPCWYDASTPPNWQQPPAFNGQQINVWCSMVWQPFSANTRTITYSACPSTLTSTQCAAQPTLQAIVTFDDYPPGLGVPNANPVACELTGFCGQSLTQNSWLWSPTVPTVSSVSPATATISGNNAATNQPQTLTISGSGLVQGATSINFVQETGPSGSPPNAPSVSNSPSGVIVTVPMAQVTWGGCSGATCSVSALAPAITSGTDYFVTLTTPAGTSPYLSPPSTYIDYKVTTVAPVVTGISGSSEVNGVPGGSITGGSTIALTGTGFYNASNFAAQVWFWPVGGGSRVQATNVDVISGTSLTANAPAVNATGNYYVQVDTINSNSTSTSFIFNYGVQVPIIISLSPTTGTTNTQVTITGGNFLSGSTVTLFNDQAGAPSGNGTNASATVTSQSSLTFTVPNGLAAGSYFPVITLPSPYTPANGYPASQPYNEPADIFIHS